MAQAREIKGLDCEANAAEWAAETLRIRLAEVLELRGVALHSEGTQGVHDMRVTTRRLRSALRDFSHLLRKKPLKKFKTDIKNIADALGAARDEDVAIIALEKLQKKSDSEKVQHGINKLIDERRQQREQAQLDLMETLTISRIDNLQADFNAAIDEAARSSKKQVSFNEAGHNVVNQSLEDFCDLIDNIYEPFVDEPLHKLRLAAKRLRYSMELYTACWGEKIAPYAESVAEMQGFLGEVHDADVWLETLSKNLKHTKKSDEVQANTWLLSEFVKKRTKNYRHALKLWRKWEKDDFIENLRSVVKEATA
jgi:CHAD domain-containing protein